MGVYEDLGIRRVINGSGPMTHLGGSIPDPRVMDAMKEASQSFIVMMELIEKAGKIIAEATGAEAGLVTSGASAAMVLAAAACLMKDSELEKYDVHPFEKINFDQDWRAIIQKLPVTDSMRNEFIIQRKHRNAYEHAYVVAGGKLVEVGTDRGCTVEEIEKAIGPKTIALVFTAKEENMGVPLASLVDLGKKHHLLTIVDAAAELPPRSNLKKYIAEGADLVVYSGGKMIGGPNGTGMLCGRRDLIKLATLQSAPYRGIGRGMKVDRNQIIGFITALKLWLARDEAAEIEDWKAKSVKISSAVKELPKVENSKSVVDEKLRGVQTIISLKKNHGVSAPQIVFDLRKGNPSIWLNVIDDSNIGISTTLLKNGEEQTIILALKEKLS
jgi:L-seryl-tRNA(Ser) seleniumtransferase